MTDTDPRCQKCGHPRSNHPYRHIFVGPSQLDTVEALAAKLAEAERAARYEANAVRQTIDQMKAEKARADAAEAKLAEADAMIEAQQKDYASNNVRFAEAEHRAKAAEAALPAVYRLALEDAYWSREVTPTPTAAELMARINEGEKE